MHFPDLSVMTVALRDLNTRWIQSVCVCVWHWPPYARVWETLRQFAAIHVRVRTVDRGTMTRFLFPSGYTVLEQNQDMSSAPTSRGRFCAPGSPKLFPRSAQKILSLKWESGHVSKAQKQQKKIFVRQVSGWKSIGLADRNPTEWAQRMGFLSESMYCSTSNIIQSQHNLVVEWITVVTVTSLSSVCTFMYQVFFFLVLVEFSSCEGATNILLNLLLLITTEQHGYLWTDIEVRVEDTPFHISTTSPRYKTVHVAPFWKKAFCLTPPRKSTQSYLIVTTQRSANMETLCSVSVCTCM